jgi:glutamate synthase domain-containing protein 1
MIGLTDRIRLRPLTAATKGNMLFLSSEESAIRLVCPQLDRAWIPMGGEPIVGSLDRPIVAREPLAAQEAAT